MSVRLDRRTDWRIRAACRRDPELWFSEKLYGEAIARHVCVTHCPVLAQCSAEAHELLPILGVQGGVIWARVKNRTYGRPARHQPIKVHCGEHCARWRDD